MVVIAVLGQTNNDILTIHVRPNGVIGSIVLFPSLVVVVPIVDVINNTEGKTLENAAQISFQTDIEHEGTDAALDVSSLQHIAINRCLVGIVTTEQVLTVNGVHARLNGRADSIDVLVHHADGKEG